MLESKERLAPAPTAAPLRLHTDEQLLDRYGQFVNPSYPSFLRGLGLEHPAATAEGATLTDSAGNSYIDCTAGYGLFNLGHNHPGVRGALIDQLQQRQAFSRPLILPLQVRLAEALRAVAPGDLACSFLCNSGSEAVDAAIKLIRLHQGSAQIVVADGAFHGHTLGAISASGIPALVRAFQPLLPGFVRVPFGDVSALRRALQRPTAAVFIEPVQHEAGVRLPPPGYLGAVRGLCDECGALLVFDEVKTGFGRTGRMFACQHWNVVPDLLVLGKSLGGGLMPVGALLARSALWKRFGLSFAMSASTCGGNILACRAALATLECLRESDLIERAAAHGARLLREFRAIATRHPALLRAVEGIGLLLGIEVSDRAHSRTLARELIRRGVLVMPAFANPAVLMVEPPLVIDEVQTSHILGAFSSACQAHPRSESCHADL